MDERGPGLLQIIQDFSEHSSPLDFVLIAQHWDIFGWGILYTVALVAVSLLIGTPLSLLLAIARANRHPVTSQIIWAYTYVFRGTPLLVQLYLIYFGLGQFEALRSSFAWVFFEGAWNCTLLAFTLNTCAYTTEIFRGAIEAVPFGEIEAAKACGMTPFQRNMRVVLPNALRRALPAYSNEVIFMLHGSVVASTVTIDEVLGAGKLLNSKYYLAYEGYIAAAVIFMLLVYLISRGFKLWEHKWHAHLRPREA